MYEHDNDETHAGNSDLTNRIEWLRKDNYCIKSVGLPYTIAAWKNRNHITYRASRAGQFITEFLVCPDEAKQACELDHLEQTKLLALNAEGPPNE